jgi:ssRNA-specific RNase YbeY (16S rRNA maturation enzyme)
LYIAHGLLHLHGFDDKAPAAAAEMESAQEKLMALSSG